MRLFVVAVCLLTTALAGCVDPLAEGFPPDQVPALDTAANETRAPPAREGATAEPAPRSAPLVTQVATARFTAPGPVTLATATDGDIAIRLIGDPDGVSCLPSSVRDPMAAPAGYRVDRVWVACALAADNQTFTRQVSDDLTSMLPLMLDIPVDHFTWSYEVGRILVNNAGEHEQLLFNGTRSMWAAPALALGATDAYHTVCDTRWDSPSYPEGVETLTWAAEAIRGVGSIEVDVGDQRVIEATSSHGNVTHVNGTSIYRADGDWGDANVSLSLTIDFEGDGDSIFLLPGCGGLAFTADFVELSARFRVDGIAAGWSSHEETWTPIEVFVREV